MIYGLDHPELSWRASNGRRGRHRHRWNVYYARGH